MGKGKNKPNAFYFFMLDWKSKQERKGVNFPNGIKDVQVDPACNEEWKSLPENRKMYFKELAKNSTGQPKIQKRTGNGELIEEIRLAEQKAKEFHDNMIEYITDTVKKAKARNAIPDIKFFIIHINYFYFRQIDLTNQIEYYPAEISIGEFTIRNGLKRKYHCIVNELPKVGFAQTCKEQSEKTHQIPLQPPFGKTSYPEIFYEICQFLEPKSNGKYPPLYTVSRLEDNYDCTKSVLSRLAAASNEADDFFTVYSLEDLLTITYNNVISPDVETPIEPLAALIEIKKDTNAYKPGLCCDYHESVQVGTLFCSQALIQRWYFTFCIFCCEPLGIEVIPGIHTPKSRVIPTECLDRLERLNISGKSRRGNSSMSEISYDFKKNVSERTSKEEQRRKAEANARPFTIIDRSKLPAVIKPDEPVLERPLRAPYSRSAGLNFDSTDTESIDFSECSFPSIGRGAIKKKPAQKSGTGHGYADVVKH